MLIADHSAWTKLVLSGFDRKKFLNGLVTCDVFKLKAGEGGLCCLLTPKGRLRADFELYDRGEDLLMLATPLAGANLKEDLSKKLILSESTLADISLEYALFHLSGPDEAVSGAEGFPETRYADDGRWLLVAAGAAEALKKASMTPEAWEALRVRRGVPLYGVDMGEETIPQEAKLDAAMTFDKGCYMGQETISRVHHMGHINKVLVRLKVSGPLADQAALQSQGQEVGAITSYEDGFALGTGRLKESEVGTQLIALPATPVEVI